MRLRLLLLLAVLCGVLPVVAQEIPRPPASPKSSPLSGEPPFYGYTWVFCADLIAGALIGLLAVQRRAREGTPAARKVWMLVGLVFGAAGGALVFLPFFVFNALWSVGFIAMSPTLMFGLTFTAILLSGLGAVFNRRW